ncbi:hypothetical protein KBC40_02045 [Patescibacteria group bacterium]|nr:hypothetical protein [Patescibacteria group bacterium]
MKKFSKVFKINLFIFLVFSLIFQSFFTLIRPLQAATLLSDDFTGTTIDTAKWVETDSGGIGGTVGSVQQNGSLSVTGSSTWAAKMLRTVDTYTRDSGDVTFSVDITIPNCSTDAMAISYGGHTLSTATYFAYYYSGALNFRSFISPNETATISPSWSCTNNVPFNMKLVILSAGGAEVYIDDVLKGALVGGTYTGTFAIQGFI